ncbi:MAG: hypothetical protein IBX40_05345 [Methanosarcinales archaeon]|nr:hypothetical protein [Methanosarcinales archaeon]
MNLNLTIRNIGIVLVILGVILLMVFWVYTILTAEVDPIIRISLIAIIIGIMITLFSILQEKVKNKDKETKRKY